MSQNGIRQLSQEEMALVFGGARPKTVTLDPVKVNADLPPQDWHVYMPDPRNGHLIPMPTGQLDAHVDAIARLVEAAIKANPQYQNVEIGQLIIKQANGILSTSPFVYGSADNPGAMEYKLGEWGIQPGQILGIIHSHPAGVFPAETHEVNKYPSDNRTVGGVTYEGSDWTTADILRDHGMNADTFRHYIIGPDGVTREYDFNDRDAETLGGTL